MNLVLFKQLLVANAIDFNQLDFITLERKEKHQIFQEICFKTFG